MKSLQKCLTLLGTLLGLFLPLILGFIGGFDQEAFSMYYFTDAKLFFVFSLTLISLSFVSLNRKWFIPSLSLLVLTYFNCIDFYQIHVRSTYIFFISSFVLMYQDKRFGFIGKLMIFSLPFYFYSIYVFELVAVMFITIFHLLYLRLLFKKEII